MDRAAHYSVSAKPLFAFFVSICASAVLTGCKGDGDSASAATPSSHDGTAVQVQPSAQTPAGAQSSGSTTSPSTQTLRPSPTPTVPVETPPQESSNEAPTITGNARTSISVNSTYTFTPSAADPDNDTLAFQIQNKPRWATFNTVKGTLSGTPGIADTASYPDIVISVNDGSATASLEAFSITVQATAPKEPSANPLGIAFKTSTNVELYAKPTAMVIAGRCGTHSTSAEMQAVRAGGGEVLQYIIPSEVPDNLHYCSLGRDQLYYTSYGKTVPLWPWKAADGSDRRKWPGAKMTDMRPGSAWINHTVAYIEGLMRSGKVDGVFLDTVGARTYAALAKWESWSSKEKDAYTLGNLELVKRLDELRDRINPGFILVNNSVWHRADAVELSAQGEKYVNGVSLEHHASTSTWHQAYAAKTFGVPGKRRVLIIANSQDEARKWAKLPGVTHVSGQTTPEYTNPLVPAVESTHLADWNQ